MTYVLTLNREVGDAIARYIRKASVLSANVTVVSRETAVSGVGELSSGEHAVRRSFQRIFTDALEPGYTTVAIFEDDVQFIENFETRIRETLYNEPECSCFLNSRTGCYPGMLLLGATSWGHQNLRFMQHESKA